MDVGYIALEQGERCISRAISYLSEGDNRGAGRIASLPNEEARTDHVPTIKLRAATDRKSVV